LAWRNGLLQYFYSNLLLSASTLFFFAVPPENFTREGVEEFIVYTSAFETIKIFWAIGFFFLVVGRLRLLESFKIQPNDHVQWQKLPKVIESLLS
jgi:hypothetical protein